jgi:hypothetical protein
METFTSSMRNTGLGSNDSHGAADFDEDSHTVGSLFSRLAICPASAYKRSLCSLSSSFLVSRDVLLWRLPVNRRRLCYVIYTYLASTRPSTCCIDVSRFTHWQRIFAMPHKNGAPCSDPANLNMKLKTLLNFVLNLGRASSKVAT